MRTHLPRTIVPRAALAVVVTGATVAAGLAVAGPASAASQKFRYITHPAVSVGGDARTIAVDPGAQRAYVSNFADDTISVLNTATNAVVATVPVGDGPNAVAVNPTNHKVYVTNVGANNTGNTVTVVDGTTDTVAATATVGSYPTAVEVDRATGKAYVTNYSSGSVSIIDGSSNAVTGSIAVSPGPTGLAVDPGIQRVYVVSGPYNDGVLSVINSNTAVVIKTTTIYNGYIALDSGVHNVYVVDATGYFQIFTSDGTFKAYIDVRIDCLCKDEFNEYGTHPTSLAVDPTTRTAYIGGGRGRPYPSVQALDLVTRTVTDRPRIVADVNDVAVDTITHTSYAVTRYNGVVPIKRLTTVIQQEAPVSATVQQGTAYAGQLAVSNSVGAVQYSTVGDPGPISVGSGGQVSAPAGTPAGVYTAVGKTRDAKGGYGSWSFTLTVTDPSQASADLSATVTAPATAAKGSSVTVTTTVSNAGPSAAGQPKTTVAIPEGWAVTDTGGATVKDGAATYSASSLASGASATYTLKLVPGVTGTATFYGIAGSETKDPKRNNNVAAADITVN